jgi:hypothetical protein
MSPIIGYSLIAGIAGLVTGCTQTSAPGERPGPPAMPTVSPPLARFAPQPTDDELVAAALRAGRNLEAVGGILRLATDASQRARVGTRLVTENASRDPAFAARLAAALPPGLAQTSALEIAGDALAQTEPEAALRWAEETQLPETGTTVRRAVAGGLVHAGGRSAMDRIQARPANSAREELLVFAVAAWARREPVAAEGWVRGLPAGERRERLTSSVGFELAQKDPRRALALAETLPAGRNRWLLISAIGQTWVATDPKAALSWANGLPAGQPRDAAFAGVDTGLGVPTSRRAGAIPSSGSGGGGRARGAGTTPYWPELESPDFAAWLSTQRPGMTRDEAIIEYVRQRGALDSGAIGAWLAALPGGPARDQAMEIYLEGQMIGAPQRAASWLRSLPRSDRNDALIERAARRWLQTNPDAAEPWLLETPLPPYLKERLLREAGR